MQLTKFGHSCVQITDGDHRVLVDPGTFSSAAHLLEDTDAVLITHQHPDHVDVDALAAALSANAALHVWGPADLAAQLAGRAEFEDRFSVVGPGAEFQAGGLPVRTFGGQHAVIHPSIPIVSNVAMLIGDAVYHPGDSFSVPNATVEVALVPLHAPWSKLAEVVDFGIAVRAGRAFQIHDSLLTDAGRAMAERHVTTLTGPFGTSFSHLDTGQTVDL